MEIHQAVADFSEDLVLAYLRERSEAVGIPTTFSVSDGDGDGRDTCSSDDDRLEANREYDTDRKTLLERNAYWDETERKHLERYTYRDETERKSMERSLYRDEMDRNSLERNTRRDVTETTTTSLERECREREVRSTTTSVRAKQRATSIDSGVVCVDAKKENVVNRVSENEEREASRRQRVTVANERFSDKQSAFPAIAVGNAEEEEEACGMRENTCGNSLVLPFRKGDVFAVSNNLFINIEIYPKKKIDNLPACLYSAHNDTSIDPHTHTHKMLHDNLPFPSLPPPPSPPFPLSFPSLVPSSLYLPSLSLLHVQIDGGMS